MQTLLIGMMIGAAVVLIPLVNQWLRHPKSWKQIFIKPLCWILIANAILQILVASKIKSFNE